MSYEVNCQLDDSAKQVSKIASRLFDSAPTESNKRRCTEAKLNISVVNTTTLEEYEGEANFDTEFMPKLNHWISKKRFKVNDDHDDEIGLKVSNMFDFTLKKKPKSDVQKIAEEVEKLQAERLEIDKEMKLLQNYFFGFWRESARESIKAAGTPIVDCEQLYFKVTATGHAEQIMRDLETQELEGGLLSALEDNISQGPATS